MSEQQIELILPDEEVDPREADVIQERQQDQTSEKNKLIKLLS